ncbi:MAG: GNAT family protein [Bdellovibrionota bacterium]
MKKVSSTKISSSMIAKGRTTRRLVIRPWKLSDYSRLVETQKKAGPRRDKFDTPPLVLKDLTREKFRKSVLEQRRTAKEDSRYVYNIFLKSGEYVGFMDVKTIVRQPYQWADIGYYVVNTYRGNGYAREAVRGLVKIAFEDLKFHRLEAVIDTDNKASIALAKSAGLTREGIRKHFWNQDGRWVDQVIFATTPELFR